MGCVSGERETDSSMLCERIHWIVYLLGDPFFLRDNVTQKNSKEQFESAQKVEQEDRKYFTAVIQGGALVNICTQILVDLEQEQNKALWIPANAL
ncbi:disks large homolog 5-like [Rana temporaria]|uniref:disks large homolog 5-like n=1 Tax=Rana temporaria TaxID=8407 RepID=UPI001AADFF0F|nr:disks large homolog 5-like [Rana temporaria]